MRVSIGSGLLESPRVGIRQESSAWKANHLPLYIHQGQDGLLCCQAGYHHVKTQTHPYESKSVAKSLTALLKNLDKCVLCFLGHRST